MKKSIIFITVLLITLLFSCQNTILDIPTKIDNQATAENYTKISIKMQPAEDSRTILPENLILSDCSVKLLGTRDNTPEKILKEWTFSSSDNNIVRLKSGMWNFTLNVYKKGKIILTDSQKNVSLTGTDLNIYFNLKSSDKGNGSINIRFVFPNSTTEIPGIKKIIANLIYDDEKENIVDTQILLPKNYETNSEKQFIDYINNSVPTGYYFLRFYLYQTEDPKYTNFYSTYIKVNSDSISQGLEEIYSLNSFHKLTLNLNGGTWNENFTIPSNFSEFNSFSLPTDATLENMPNTYIAGWYELPETKNLADAKIITEIPAGTTHDMVLYAKWNFKCNSSKIKSIFDNCNQERFGIKILKYNSEISGLSDNNKYIDIDFSDATYQFEYVDIRNCSSLIDINLESVTDITSLRDNTNLRTVYIPDSVTHTGLCVFSNCSNLVSVTGMKNIKTIDRWFQDGCTSLKSFIVPDSCIEIRGEAFNHCTALEYILIPKNVKDLLGNNNFIDTPKLLKINYLGTKEEFLTLAISKTEVQMKADLIGKTIICSDGNIDGNLIFGE